MRERCTLRTIDDVFYLEDNQGNLTMVTRTRSNNSETLIGILDACHFYKKHADDPFAFFFEPSNGTKYGPHLYHTFTVAFLQMLYIQKPSMEVDA
jgi:hypothetical protein